MIQNSRFSYRDGRWSYDKIYLFVIRISISIHLFQLLSLSLDFFMCLQNCKILFFSNNDNNMTKIGLRQWKARIHICQFKVFSLPFILSTFNFWVLKLKWYIEMEARVRERKRIKLSDHRTEIFMCMHAVEFFRAFIINC